jgi:phospholipid/cholesterol/gamma-HCH transport system substrate-binding protein
MGRKPITETLVGLFMMAGIVALAVLAFKVSGLAQLGHSNYYVVTAQFDNIGDLKVRAPVSIGGVRIGQVSNIVLNSETFRAQVSLDIDDKFNNIPADSIANIYTQGLLGSNYISLSPGFDTQVLKNGAQIQTTHSAIILENLIGQLLLSMSDKAQDETKDNNQQ